MRWAWGIVVLVLVGVACSDSVTVTHLHRVLDGGPGDGGPGDGGPGDGGPGDGGPGDAGPGDGGPGDGGPGDGGPRDGGPGDAGPDGGFDAGWSGAWEPFGPTLGHEAQVYPAMALDSAGQPLVAFVQLVEMPGVVATELRVVRWTGSDWAQLGGVVASSTARLPYSAPLFVRLATDGMGRPVLAFGDSGPGAMIGAFPLQTWVFNGVAWQPMPVPVSAPQLSGIGLSAGPDGRVRLVLSTGHELRLLVLGSSGWMQTAPALLHDAGVSEPDLSVAGDGAALVAFSAAASPGSFGTLHAFRGTDAGWSDLGLPSPMGDSLLFHTPRLRERSDGGLVVGASEWQYDSMSKAQIGVGVPIFSLGEGGWVLLEDDGPPGGFALSEPIPGSPVGLVLQNDVPVVVSTGADAGVSLRAVVAPQLEQTAPMLAGVGAGTLLLLPDGGTLVGAVLPVSHDPGPAAADGGQVQIFHFTGAPAEPATANREFSAPGPSAAGGSR